MTEEDIRRIVGDELRRQGASEQQDGREVMTANAAADFLGVDRNTIYEYANRGDIPHRRLGRRVLFSRSALVVWLSSCKDAASRKG